MLDSDEPISPERGPSLIRRQAEEVRHRHGSASRRIASATSRQDADQPKRQEGGTDG
jgi:hypothetical protein